MYLKMSSFEPEDISEVYNELCKALKMTDLQVKHKLLNRKDLTVKSKYTPSVNDIVTIIKKTDIVFELKIIYPLEISIDASVDKDPVEDVSDDIDPALIPAVEIKEVKPPLPEKKEDDLPDF